MSFRNTPLAVIHDVDKETLLTPELRAEIDKHVAKYPSEWKQSAVMPALTLVQDHNGGWLSRELMDQVAAYLDMPETAVYEVATFYAMYDLEPVGRHKICVCNSVSCMLGGAEELMHHIEKKYNVAPGGTTADGKLTFKEFECLGACRHAPAVMVDKAYHECVTPETIDKIIDDLD
ncbi:NADH-quinone oxidoreductase subunit NuoE [Lamprobacter modestohalophilus]|uniref:NADH-quinone oxidoreductase subunit NuoE n=1 Tax=Lamprobacter modestohalophilus TaxID=1064514 RepID=UPI002ADEE853|nr:NADH-quinone oxidoreductase subunit NuoE [Lamprobacter modestohalophilus]MEA1050304.1 NADH-quinone oxidoreductase subunit NuoE [Lamprobacter modestohalophilus]